MLVSRILAPFSWEIRNHKIATTIMVPMMRYNGTIDPFDHVEEFKAYLDAYNPTDAAKCKVFPITLMLVKQKPDESMRSYVKLFNNIHSQVHEPTEKMAI